MKTNVIYKTSAALLMLISFGCTKNFEEINSNPNRPENAPLTNILAFTIQDHAANIFNTWGDMNEPSTYSGQLSKIAYLDESRYQFRPNIVENMWTFASRELKNLEVIIQQSRAENATNMEAVALTFQTYVWQFATDRWRDLPFEMALKGDEGFISPEYDTQEDVYPVLLERLKNANELFAQGGSDELGGGDLLFGGDVQKWQRFANSLRLRLAIRVSNVAPDLAKTHIEEIMSDVSTYPIMESNDDNAFFIWPGNLPYWEPWFQDGQARNDYSVSDVMIDQLVALADPRLPVYAKPAPQDGAYRGSIIGRTNAAQSAAGPASRYSPIGARFRDDVTGFSPFMRVSEVQFILAEAALKGWNVGVDAKTAYDNALTLSLEENGLSTSEIEGYLSTGAGAYNGTLQQLYLQKWISLFKNGQEAWAETRRTDVPVLNAAPGSPYPGHNRPPFRYPYPTSETNLNSANSGEYVASVEDNFWGKQMWWDTRQGVN